MTTTSDVIALIGGSAGILTLLNSLRKTNSEVRASSFEELQGIVRTLRDELERTTTERAQDKATWSQDLETMREQMATAKRDCDQQIGTMKEMIIVQADQIRQLERRKTPRSNGGGGTAP
jgi:hypothetical protein